MPRWVVVVGVVIVVLFALAVGGLFALHLHGRSSGQDLGALPRRAATVHGRPLTLLVATAPDQVGAGLSGQEGLAADTGLLLVSPDGDTRVTMLGMRFALDVVWLDAGGRVVHVERGARPGIWPLAYTSPTPAASVVELPAGEADRLGLAVGDALAS